MFPTCYHALPICSCVFSELYYKAIDEEGWTASRYTVFDTDSLHPDEVTRLKRDMSETSFAREYLCDFSAQGDDQLIALADTEDAAKRVYQRDHVRLSPIVLGIDPARFGDDRSVVFRRQGRQAFKPVVYRGIDNMELAARVANLIEEHDPDAVFVDAGAGSGPVTPAKAPVSFAAHVDTEPTVESVDVTGVTADET